MNSVNHPQTVPYTRGYEMAPTPAPIRYEESAEAQSNHAAESEPSVPRQPLTPQQRGQFAAHNELVNPSTAKQTDAEQLAGLARENDKILSKYNEVVGELSSTIKDLQQQISKLTQQFDASKNLGNTTTPSTRETSGDNRPNDVTPDMTVPTENTPASEPNAPRSLEKLAGENEQLQLMIKSLATGFEKVVEQLQQQINELIKKLGHTGTPENQSEPSAQAIPADPEMANNTPAENTPTSSDEIPATPSAEPTQSGVSPSVEALTRENEKLSASFQEMTTKFKTVTAQLEQQIVDLTAKITQQNQQ